jgi:Ca2+-binding EF-hand superfamily protein
MTSNDQPTSSKAADKSSVGPSHRVSVTRKTLDFLVNLFRIRRKSQKSKQSDPELLCKLFKLTHDELKSLRSAFNDFDLNRDGFINEEELGAVLRNLGQPAERAEVKQMIDKVDDDRSGNVDFYEFLKMMTNHMDQKTYDEELKAVFRAFDCNNNGYISQEELRNAMKLMGERLNDEELAGMMEVADTNKDGRISLEGSNGKFTGSV